MSLRVVMISEVVIRVASTLHLAHGRAGNGQEVSRSSRGAVR
ncbi:hypothetical protein KOR42_26750 [Thalassoglobus neptunius]|uniref:Uncharacterized protein n=1 Tax=Thalassoglobus neptunius TaxID=1938619 RepID=A0A5C5WY71_9PLAN|nr:hypothetical protein KOR42_26750 [Thalassoglobus neptunius]